VERAPDSIRWARVQGVRVPTFLYGTAWKEDATARLTRLALDAGFRGIDTANQRRHYHEAGVGEALAAAGLRREDVFLQTKFTYAGGQDHRLPYDPRAPLATQVEQSFASSLEHLGVDALDSYVLHGPSVRHGMSDDDWETWRAMERLHAAGQTRLLGVSNVSLPQLAELDAGASDEARRRAEPMLRSTGWDRAVRTFCASAASCTRASRFLTAERRGARHRRVHAIAARTGRTIAQVIFRFAIEAGMIRAHRARRRRRTWPRTWHALDFALDPDDVRAIEQLVA
jgi:diketogulonate reductase-like aldo/keto reductase